MEKGKNIASCFIVLEDFIIKESVASVGRINAMKALNRLSDFFVAAGVCANPKEHSEIKSSPPTGRLLKEGESLPREQGKIYDSEEKLIDSSLAQIRNIVEVELKGEYKEKVTHSLNVIDYYIKGLSKISKKFEKEWVKAKDEKTINSTETDENIKPYNAQSLIVETCDKIKEMLLDKNRKYGNSALSPKRVFSKAHIIEQINVRMDDKLSRISMNQADDSEDAEWDLLGYLILKRIALKIHCLEKKEL